MKNKDNLFTKKAIKRRLKSFPELNALIISWIISISIAAFLFALAGNSPVAVIIASAYLASGVWSFILERAARSSIAKNGCVPMWVRRGAILLIPFAAAGNLFAAIAGFMAARQDRTVEYNLISYAFLNNLFAIVISAVNLFKPKLYDKFWLGIALFAATLVIYLAAMALILIFQKKNMYKKLAPVAVVLILTAFTGNLFALMLGMVILAKIRNLGSSKAIEWIDTIRRVFRNYMSVIGLFVIILMITLSICSYFTFNYQLAVKNDYGSLMKSPSLAYPFGTDNLGRCVFTRIVFGARISLLVGIISTAIPFIIGGLLGAVAGHYSTKFDNIIMRILDVLNAVPSILLAMAVMAALGSSITNMVIALSISNIPVYARTMRAQVMVVSQNEFVEATKAYGRKGYESLLFHIIPNSMAPMIVRASVSIGIAILSTSSLSYLGLGIGPHIPEWGNILKVGSSYLETNPYLAIYPGIFIIILVLAFNFLGDGLRDALDPKLK